MQELYPENPQKKIYIQNLTDVCELEYWTELLESEVKNIIVEMVGTLKSSVEQIKIGILSNTINNENKCINITLGHINPREKVVHI